MREQARRKLMEAKRQGRQRKQSTEDNEVEIFVSQNGETKNKQFGDYNQGYIRNGKGFWLGRGELQINSMLDSFKKLINEDKIYEGLYDKNQGIL